MKRVVALALLAICSVCCGGHPATPSTQTAPNYAGTWSGTYTDTSCTQSGSLATLNLCAVSARDLYSLILIQSGWEISATFTLGTVKFPATTGTIGADGSLSLTSTNASLGLIVLVATWHLNLTSSGALAGTVTQTWTDNTGVPGSIVITSAITTAVRNPI